MKKKSYCEYVSFVTVGDDFGNELRKALTHPNFYEDTTQGNKFIFLGMFVFKGKIAEILYQYFPLNSKQLQHYLGNLFKNDILERIYHRYQLSKMIRYDKKLDISDKHHLFVYGFLGFVGLYADAIHLQKFIYTNFIKGTDYLLPTKNIAKDYWQQCIYLCQMYYGTQPEIKEHITENQSEISIFIQEEKLCSATADTEKVARKKATKEALRVLASRLEEELQQDPMYQLRQKEREKAENERIIAEKVKKFKEYKKKQQKRSQKIAERKAQRKEEAQERDTARRKAKLLAKKRREEQANKKAKQVQELANLSVAKRRHLQDKGILPKGKN